MEDSIELLDSIMVQIPYGYSIDSIYVKIPDSQEVETIYCYVE